MSIYYLTNLGIPSQTVHARELHTPKVVVTNLANQTVYSLPSSAPSVNGETIIVNTNGTSSFAQVPSMADFNALEQAIGVPEAGTFLSPPLVIDNAPDVTINGDLNMGPNYPIQFSQPASGTEASILYSEDNILQFHNSNLLGFNFDKVLRVNNVNVASYDDIRRSQQAISIPALDTLEEALLNVNGSGQLEVISSDLSHRATFDLDDDNKFTLSGAVSYAVDNDLFVTGSSDVFIAGNADGIQSQVDELKDTINLFGTTAQRPVAPPDGQMYFDSTLGKPVWFDGTEYVDATGTAA